MSKVEQRLKHFELVLGGHPDKVCDIIANRLSQLFLEVNPQAKTAIEVTWFSNIITVFGEVSGVTVDDRTIKETVTSLMSSLDYNEDFEVKIHLIKQSQEIQQAVGSSGAGDNGIFITGYHKVWSPIVSRLKSIAEILTSKAPEYNYRTDGKFVAEFNVEESYLEKFTLNIASNKDLTKEDEMAFKRYLHNLLNHFVNTSIETVVEINPKGNWQLCGGFADSGLTGRKLACDNTLGLFKQGGGAFFGKDYSKADHSVPIYLYDLAKTLIYTEAYDGEDYLELHAHTIIGDTEVKIFNDNSLLVEEQKFENIKDYAHKNPMSYVGLK